MSLFFAVGAQICFCKDLLSKPWLMKKRSVSLTFMSFSKHRLVLCRVPMEVWAVPVIKLQYQNFTSTNYLLVGQNQFCMDKIPSDVEQSTNVSLGSARSKASAPNIYWGDHICFAWTKHQLIPMQWCINRVTCSHPELNQDHVLTSAYVVIC